MKSFEEYARLAEEQCELQQDARTCGSYRGDLAVAYSMLALVARIGGTGETFLGYPVFTDPNIQRLVDEA